VTIVSVVKPLVRRPARGAPPSLYRAVGAGNHLCVMLTFDTGLTEEAIVLTHDGIGSGARREDARETVAYTERVIEFARATRLALEAMS
jgi:hypothetical protein